MLPDYEGAISEITLQEIENTASSGLKGNLNNLITDFTVLKMLPEIASLAQEYLHQQIFPAKYYSDALHVAIASYCGVAFILSWNFHHIVKVRTRKLVNLVNVLNGYKDIEIISPQEL